MQQLFLLSLNLLLAAVGCQPSQPASQNSMAEQTAPVISPADSITPIVLPEKIEKLVKTEAEWKAQLTAQEFYVLREKGTERAFTGDLVDNHADGTFVCAACNLPLFSSKTKFDSGTGWPSFFKPLCADVVAEHRDNGYGMTRVEIVCGRCGGHLGHVFEDGPAPTGLRYCMNSVSMNFVAGH